LLASYAWLYQWFYKQHTGIFDLFIEKIVDDVSIGTEKRQFQRKKQEKPGGIVSYFFWTPAIEQRGRIIDADSRNLAETRSEMTNGL